MANDVERVRNFPLTLRIRIGSDVGVYKSVLRTLGSPENIFFWWSEAEKILLVGVGDETSKMSVPIPNRCYEKTNGFVSTNKQLLDALGTLTGWEKGSKNKIVGKFIHEINMVAFKTAEVVTEVCING